MAGKSRKLLKRGSHQFQARKEKIKHSLLALPDDHEAEILPKTDFLFSTLISNGLNDSKKTNNVQRNNNKGNAWENCILSVPTNNHYCISTNKILELKLPSALVNASGPEANNLFSKIFSLKTWNSLPKDVQNNLMKFLPNFQKLSEDEQLKENDKTIQQLFSGNNFHFSNPIQTFVKNLTGGRYTKENKNYRNKVIEQQYKFACYLKAYNQNMIRRILFFKEQIGVPENHSYLLYPPLARQYDATYLLDDVNDSDTEEDSENEDHDLSYHEFDLKEQIQQFQLKKDELCKSENSDYKNSHEFREIINTNEVATSTPTFKSPGNFQRPAPIPITPAPTPPKRNLAKRKKSTESIESAEMPPKKKMKVSNTKSRSTPKPIVYDESYPSPPEHPGPVWMFFPTIREIFIQNNNAELDLATIISEFKKDKERVSLVYSTYTLENFISIGLLFLEKPPNVSSSATPVKEKPEVVEPRSKKSKSQKSRGSKSNETPKATQAETSATPPSTSPASIPTILNPTSGASPQSAEPANESYEVGGAYVRFNPATQKWKWIGDLDEEFSEELDTLELLFYFSITRKMVSPDQNLLNLIPIKQQKCSTTIVPSTAEEVEAFQEQERNRYLSPEKPFTYVFRNSQVCVAPMKRGLGNQKQKPRDHFLLKKDRPPHISLLCLVRDAAARLPGGIGTRPDVAILLRDSQYIVNDVAETQLNTVVSGALDRLHAEVDPCVRFDAEQKLWIYLHRRRKESNFAIFKPKRRGKK